MPDETTTTETFPIAHGTLPAPQDRIAFALEQLVEEVRAMRHTFEMAFGRVLPGKMSKEDIEAVAQREPHSLLSGYIHGWLHHQLQMEQAAQEAAAHQMGRILTQGGNGGRRR